MKKQLICLANSRKYGGRCLAGIEVFRDENQKLQLTRQPDGKPKWIRPVSETEFGAVPNLTTKHIQLLDIVSFDAGIACPENYQTENVFYLKKEFQKESFLHCRCENLDQLADCECQEILGSRSKSIRHENIGHLDRSIVLIKTDEPKLIFKEWGSQLRLGFSHRETFYDLPVTDTDFHCRWIDRPNLVAAARSIYLCISISLERDGWHQKLVAGVLWGE